MSVSVHAKAKKMRTYEAPSSQPAYLLWRAKMWCEVTFALSMMERWEKFLIYGFFLAVTLLMFTGLVSYLPQHLRFLHSRAAYYLLGDDRRDLYAAAASTFAKGAAGGGAGGPEL